jgi:hypothetical protein
MLRLLVGLAGVVAAMSMRRADYGMKTTDEQGMKK